MALQVVAHIHARRDKQDELRELLTGLVGPTRKEAGCFRYQLFRNNADPADFTFIEEWENAAALDAHLRTPHLKAALAALPGLTDVAPVISRYSLIA